MTQVKSPNNAHEVRALFPKVLVKKKEDDVHQVLICKFGEVGDGEYIDHRGRQVVIFDHIKQVF